MSDYRHRQSTLPTEVVVQTCDSIREELEKRDLKKYVNSILTAHVVKQPPDHEAGLSLLLRLKGERFAPLIQPCIKRLCR